MAVRVPRLDVCCRKSDVDQMIRKAVQKLNYESPTTDQMNAIREFVFGRDVFIMLPTGSGKSLCYATLPIVFDLLRAKVDSSIVIIVSPLQSIMEDQVKKYSARGLQAAFVGKAQKDDVIKDDIVNGKYRLVYMSPESMLLNLKWREMFRSEVYQNNLMCLAIDEAHCVEKWGMQFRQEFSNIGEIRSLLPRGTNIMALTATANMKTRENVMKSLEMVNAYVIANIPNNPNIFFAVLRKPIVDDDFDMSMIVEPIVQSIIEKGVSADRHLVFCRTYSETVALFEESILKLDEYNSLYVPDESLPHSFSRTCEKYDACTSDVIKRHIVKSFTDPNGTIRAVFATVAFAMGLDSPNIYHVMHWGPTVEIETYIQEVGRCGRDGKLATAILLYQPKDFQGKPGVSMSMKEYCINTSECRRIKLMSGFGITDRMRYPTKPCLCCDICAATCSCQSCTLPASFEYFKRLSTISNETSANSHSVDVNILSEKQVSIKSRLLEYRRQLCEQASIPDASLMVGIEIASGISDRLIDSIIKNYTLIKCKNDLIGLGVSQEYVDIFFDIIMSP